MYVLGIIIYVPVRYRVSALRICPFRVSTVMSDGARGNQTCGACNSNAVLVGRTGHVCLSCSKPLHLWIMTNELNCSVWMPKEEGCYNCQGGSPLTRSHQNWMTHSGSWIYLRWKGYGWQLDKIYEAATNATPRLFKTYNYRTK